LEENGKRKKRATKRRALGRGGPPQEEGYAKNASVRYQERKE